MYGIFTYIYHKFRPNVGKYVYMKHLGNIEPFFQLYKYNDLFTSFFVFGQTKIPMYLGKGGNASSLRNHLVPPIESLELNLNQR